MAVCNEQTYDWWLTPKSLVLCELNVIRFLRWNSGNILPQYSQVLQLIFTHLTCQTVESPSFENSSSRRLTCWRTYWDTRRWDCCWTVSSSTMYTVLQSYAFTNFWIALFCLSVVACSESTKILLRYVLTLLFTTGYVWSDCTVWRFKLLLLSSFQKVKIRREREPAPDLVVVGKTNWWLKVASFIVQFM